MQEPATRLLSILLKYDPWRDTWLASWECGSAGVKGSCRQRAARLLHALIATCKKMHGKLNEVLPWIESVGYNISHVSGPLPTLSRWGVLRPVLDGQKRGALQLGKYVDKQTTGLKRVAKGFAETSRAVHNLTQLVKLADRIGHVSCPRSCHDWLEQHDSIVAAIGQEQVPGLLPRTYG